jgi:hypothetical protein
VDNIKVVQADKQVRLIHDPRSVLRSVKTVADLIALMDDKDIARLDVLDPNWRNYTIVHGEPQ